MRIIIHANPGARSNRVLQLEEKIFSVAVTASPEEGKANDMIKVVLGSYFKVLPEQVRIVSGFKTRIKTVEIDGV